MEYAKAKEIFVQDVFTSSRDLSLTLNECLGSAVPNHDRDG